MGRGSSGTSAYEGWARRAICRAIVSSGSGEWRPPEARSGARTPLRWRYRPRDARVAPRRGRRADRAPCESRNQLRARRRSTSRIPSAFSRGQVIGFGHLHRASRFAIHLSLERAHRNVSKHACARPRAPVVGGGAPFEAARSAKWVKRGAGDPPGDSVATGWEDKRVPSISGRRRVISAPTRGAPRLTAGAVHGAGQFGSSMGRIDIQSGRTMNQRLFTEYMIPEYCISSHV